MSLAAPVCPRGLCSRVVAILLLASLAQADTLRIASGEKDPYIGPHLTDGGYVQALIEHVLTDAGYDVELAFFPWERARVLAEKGDFDAIVSPVNARVDPSPFISTDGFPGEKLGLLKRKAYDFSLPATPTQLLADDAEKLLGALAGLRLGLVRGADALPFLDQATELSRQYVVTYEQGMKMLASERIDLLLIDKYTAADIMTDSLPHLIGQLEFVDPPLLERDFHLAVRTRRADAELLVERFNHHLRQAVQDGTLATLMASHGFGSKPAMNNAVHRLTIGTVDNPDMEIMRELSAEFEAEHPNIELDWQVLDENILRRRLMSDLAISDGQYDIMTIGTLEAPLWAERGWLVPIDADRLPAGYDRDDLIPTVREGLSFESRLYALPFYAESTMTYYRTDLFEQAGLTMPMSPTYDQIQRFAAELHRPEDGVYGICLRGKPAWGENMAFISILVNAHGGRWFDMEWEPQIYSPEWHRALNRYKTLMTEYGPPAPEQQGYTELLEHFSQGRCALWIDATVAAGTLFNPSRSRVAGTTGIASSPTAVTNRGANWLWSWALAVPESSAQQDAALSFIAWATSRDYIQRVGERKGWLSVPPGTRLSTYELADYRAAAPFSQFVLQAIQSADISENTLQPTPYVGIQFVRIPEFPAIGTNVGRHMARIITGDASVAEALQASQSLTAHIMWQAGYR
ncbi:extracellular solute-binding protein [Saccharospirillum salsuginis]|uniref:Sugar ABC transporter substrate-binding protein n=1 Tax=Saccharospirillum salsuginis TaxID=418750 RepID=A0A918KKJ0_9GAMM|nr:extracellular solute-binding protein [Saccharospirillum salsuginis]GGX67513.1 hypothetical protein GCM10007392_38920 [Saccharospirillum salsuginis]